jgi:cysteine desulfurase/selenocysteine lyase
MNIPDPRHAAATAPVASPPAPQWGGQAPSVIDPNMIAHLANTFLNAAPGQTIDPHALANFAMALDRPPAPPTSAPGAIGAATAIPGTSIPGALAVPFVTELPSSYSSESTRAPAQHIPAAGMTGFPAGSAASPPPLTAFAAPSPEKGQESALGSPLGALSEADLRSLPQSLGQMTSLTPSTFPSGFSHAAFPGAGEPLYFLNQGGTAVAPTLPATVPSTAAAAPGTSLPLAQSTSMPSQNHLASAPATSGTPGASIEQDPTFAANFPTESDLRPQGLGDAASFGPAPTPDGFSHSYAPTGSAAIPGESLYFFNEAQAAAAPPHPSTHASTHPSTNTLNGATRHSQLTGVAPELQPLLGPDSISGTRAFDAQTIKQDFPILRQQVHGQPLIWLDNAATTQKPQSVIDRIALFYETENSNIHRAAHTLAARSTDAYEAAREKVRRFLGAGSPNEIVFTRGATEAINLVAQAWGRRNVREGDEIVITWLEHHANIVPWQMLCAETGAVLRVAPVDDSGQVLLEEYTKLLGPRTRIVSLPQVSNALGTVTPAQEMVAIAHRHGACVLVDGAQAVSHMPVNVQALGCDFYVFSGHKVFGPTGIGVLYGKPDVLAAMPPWQGGGNMIADVTFEKTIYQPPPGRFEAGTGNIADAVGLGAAIDYLDRIGMGNIATYEHELLGYATQGLLGVPGLSIIGTAKEKAGVISFVLDGCRSEDVGAALDREGIAVRAGHHCAQPILRRFGIETTVRPSLALYNTYNDIDALVAALHRIQTQKSYRAR